MPTAMEAQALPFQIVGASFVALQVVDVDAASEWYRRVFGVSEVNRIDAVDGRYRIRILDRSELTVELIESSDAPSPPDRHLGLFKAGIYVDNIDAAYAWFRDQGVDVDQRIFVDEALGARSFLIRDLEGNRLQVFSRCQRECE
jgi:catechol-2,3-dioxygenase